MNILIIGGTKFLGPHIVDAALRRGHAVTTFTRGQTQAKAREDVEALIGDRDGGLSVLQGRRWDAVVDTCGYFPRIVAASAEMLTSAVDHYVFVSSISVYADFLTVGIDEEYAVGKILDQTVEEIREDTYGPLKALCEAVVQRAYPDRSTIIRPGLIVGPLDPSDRFTYWVARVARRGTVLAPTPPERPVQLIDARDLAAWTVTVIERRITGVFNATGPASQLTMRALLEACRDVAGSAASFTWVDESYLVEQEVEPWTELPIWITGDEYVGFMQAGIARAIGAGLTFRPLESTIRDTLEWHNTRPADYDWKHALKPEKEAAILRAWAARSS